MCIDIESSLAVKALELEYCSRQKAKDPMGQHFIAVVSWPRLHLVRRHGNQSYRYIGPIGQHR